MASKEDKLDIRNAKRSARQMRKGGLRVSNKAAVKFNQAGKAEVKLGRPGGALKTTSSGYKVTKTNSAKMPSVASKANAKNKIKANPKAMSSPTSGYGKSTKPRSN